jgi:hypothetical protein
LEAFTGAGFGGIGELAGTGGGWIGVDVAGEYGADAATVVEASPVSASSFSSFFFFPNKVSIPMTVKRVQIGSRLVSSTSIRSTHFY